MIEKLGITPETHGKIYCEMLEALIYVGFDSEEGGLIDWLNFKDYFMPIIEKATGRSWEEVKKIIEGEKNE